MTDSRKTRHWSTRDLLEPKPPTEDGEVTRVPCFVCVGSGMRGEHPCTDCGGTGLVHPDTRAKQRDEAGYPPSTLPADRHEKGKP